MCHIQKVKNGFRKIESKNCWESFVLEKGLWPGLFFRYLPLHKGWLTAFLIQNAADEFYREYQRKHYNMLESEVCLLFDIFGDSAFKFFNFPS